MDAKSFYNRANQALSFHSAEEASSAVQGTSFQTTPEWPLPCRGKYVSMLVSSTSKIVCSLRIWMCLIYYWTPGPSAVPGTCSGPKKKFLIRWVIFIYSVQGDNHHVPGFLLSRSKLLLSHTNKTAQKVNKLKPLKVNKFQSSLGKTIREKVLSYHYWATIIVIFHSCKNHQWMLKLVGESWRIHRIFTQSQSIFPQDGDIMVYKK